MKAATFSSAFRLKLLILLPFMNELFFSPHAFTNTQKPCVPHVSLSQVMQKKCFLFLLYTAPSQFHIQVMHDIIARRRRKGVLFSLSFLFVCFCFLVCLSGQYLSHPLSKEAEIWGQK